MRASVGGSGIVVKVFSQEKPTLDAGLTLEGNFTDYKHAPIFLRVVDEAAFNEKDPQALGRVGVQVQPPQSNYQTWERVDIFLLNSGYDMLIKSGHYGGRTVIDRIDILYEEG